jgi:acyl-CoA thioester hydrolase
MQVFSYQRKIHVYETDLMGIVHHSNYLRFCEEARVEWFQKNGVQVLTKDDIFGLVVVETRVRHKSPIRYGEILTIDIQLKTEGPRLIIQYRLRSEDPLNRVLKLCALAETIHCRIDQNFKVLRLDKKIIQRMENEKWIETWL